jgi:hypothetical protein
MNAVAKQAGRFTETEIDDEIVIMRLDTGEFFAVSGTAAAAWRLIDGSRDRGALLAALTAEFSGDEQQIEQDVDEFLAQLKATGLIASDD